jgi:AcrR family transcriptional regulator
LDICLLATSKPYNQRSETRTAILDAAERLVKQYGYAKTSMIDVAREAGLGKATLYKYFSDKVEIALAYRERMEGEMLAKMAAIKDGGGGAGERLIEILVYRVMFHFDYIQPFWQGLPEFFSAVRSAFLAQRNELLKHEVALVEMLLADGANCGEFCAELPPSSGAHPKRTRSQNRNRKARKNDG